MLPSDLNPEHFASYPPRAKTLALTNLTVLRSLPASFVPSLLREVIDYDYKFPSERRAIEKELANLARLSLQERTEWLHGFSSISVSAKLQNLDWVNSPGQFIEQLSSDLWTTHQLDAFRSAATDYSSRLHAAVPPEAPVIPRLGITVIGQGVERYEGQMFRKLRPHGAYLTRIVPDQALRVLLDLVSSRAKSHPASYAHWYIDGGAPAECDSAVTRVSYAALDPVRTTLLRRMHSEIEKPGMGPEMLRTLMAQMHLSELGFGESTDPVLGRFQVKLFTEGSGTQIFSTSFTQWAAREALRRAEPATLLVRFAPRQRQKPMNELLADGGERADVDPIGSLVDADMGAYYNWLNQQRLADADKAAFVAWFEGHNSGIVIGPGIPRGTQSDTRMDMKQVLSWVL